MFTVANTPCGRPVYVTEMSTWEGNGFPHPVTGVKQDRDTIRMTRILPGDPAYRGDGDNFYWTVALQDGTFLRVFND